MPILPMSWFFFANPGEPLIFLHFSVICHFCWCCYSCEKTFIIWNSLYISCDCSNVKEHHIFVEKLGHFFLRLIGSQRILEIPKKNKCCALPLCSVVWKENNLGSMGVNYVLREMHKLFWCSLKLQMWM